MDFFFTEEQERFRQEVRDFLDAEVKAGVFKPSPNAWIIAENEEFAHHVADRHYIGLTWPKEYGGQGRGYLDRYVLVEEMLRYGAPMTYLPGDRQVGPTIIAHGTEEQKRFFLPKIMRADVRIAIGMSEPEAGSDLGGTLTRAVEDGDSFILNGQKVWTSAAKFCDYVFMLARTNTDPKVSRYKSLSQFIVDLKLPGVTIRPLVDITGGDHWYEVFLDDVRVPKTALIGKRDNGFYHIMEQLDFERSGPERFMGNYPVFAALMDYVKNTKRNGTPLAQDPAVRRAITDLIIKYEVGKPIFYRVAWALDQGAKEAENMTRYTCMAKSYGTKFEQELDNAAMDIAGLPGQLDQDSRCAIMNGLVVRGYIFSPAHTVQGGTSEILLNILASRALGLPRE